LIHLSDLSWSEPGEVAVRNFKKGEDLEAVILAVDPERERISLGVKQLEEDPMGGFLSGTEKGAVVKGTVTEVEPKQALVDLGDGVVAILKASELSRDRVEDARNVLNVGDEIEAKISNVDRKTRQISLSVRAMEEAEEKEAMRNLNEAPAEEGDVGPTTIGELIKAQMEGRE
jgi:small subunit ribosomal protein S1